MNEQSVAYGRIFFVSQSLKDKDALSQALQQLGINGNF
jgi:hypothetical protein